MASQPQQRPLTILERHQLKIAYDTLQLPDAMAGAMGGMTKNEAKRIIYKLTNRKVN
jgi:hypothetical protein